MNLDAFTLSALVDEFMDVLVGGRVQDAIDVDATGIGLEIYADHRRRYLYLSADPQSPRVHLVPEKLRRGLQKPTQIGLLFRSKVEGGSISHISQPPWERVIQFDVDGPEGEVAIIIEPMERRSNLLIVENGIILDCIRRVGSSENRYRVSLPGKPYVPPPPQTDKAAPETVTADFLEQAIAHNQDPKRKLAQFLSSIILGVSPLIAREIVFRAGMGQEQRVPDTDPDKLFTAFRDVLQPLLRREWQPGIVDSDRGVVAFSAFPVRHLDGWRRLATMSGALTAFYATPVGEDAYSAGKGPVKDAIVAAESKLNARLASLQRSMTDESERERIRQSGELILAYQYAIEAGQTELSAQYEADSAPLSIKLDPALTPLENAQQYFDKYNRAKRALDDVPRLIRETETELAQLQQWSADLELATSWPDIDEVQQQLQAHGYWRGAPRPKPGGQRSAPLRIVTDSGFVIWVGRNSRQNEQVTFEKGSPVDLWLHARGVPGAHVIIKLDGRRAPQEVIEHAAGVAAYFSLKRGEAKVEVDVTERRHVRKIKGGGAGQVTYRNEETLFVAPLDPSSRP